MNDSVVVNLKALVCGIALFAMFTEITVVAYMAGWMGLIWL